MEMSFYDYDKYLITNLTSNQNIIYRCLMSHKNKKQVYSFPSQKLIAKETRLSISTIKRAIKVLVEKKFIIIEKVKKRMGHFNKYRMLIIPVFKKKEQQKVNETKVEEELSNISLEKELRTDVQAPVNNKNSELVKSKLNIKITDKQAYGINKFFTDKTVLETITIFKKKKGKTATFFITLCIDRAFKNGTATQHMASFYHIPFVKNQITLTECINEFSKTKPVKKLKFANYDQRNVDYDSFKDELLNCDW